MAGDIGEWLEKLGLGRYAESFADNEIDLQALPHLTEQDLEGIGVALGARRKLLAAIAELGDADEPATVDDGSDKRSASAEGERRQLTVMFCDLVGSTALSEQLDPEDLRAVIGAFQEACAGVIAGFEGYIARYMGDGLLVYFGYPQAHEDDAVRAVRTGLGIVAAVGNLNNHQDEVLEVRVGIATGLVVVGDIVGEGASEERAVTGETPNLAARLQGVAAPNTVVIADSTQRLIRGLFDYNELGPRNIKGLSEPVRAYQVLTASGVPSRFEASAAGGLTPLVGRDEEIGLLVKRWHQAQEGEGQVVLLSGEAGVGKSRIMRGLQERLEGEVTNRVLYYCSPYHQNSALHPLIDQFERALRIDKEDGPEQRLDKLEAELSDLDLASDELAYVLAAMLSLPTEERYPDPELTPQQVRAKALDATITVIEAMAARQMVLMVVEDVHWIDPSTQEFIDQLIERCRSSRLLLVITFRPEFAAPWSGSAHVTAYTLNNLSRRDCAALISGVTGGKDLPDEVQKQIVAQTDGVPLFVEELTKTVLESGLLREGDQAFVLDGPLPALAIPASLQDSLMARLDRLGTAKEVAQLAGALGRSFSHELLSAVSALEGSAIDESSVDEALVQLEAAELVHRRGVVPDVVYEFKHALVQDAAYASMLKQKRRLLHGAIAKVMQSQTADQSAYPPHVLAHHLAASDEPIEAARHWIMAAEGANAQAAGNEAVAYYRSAIEQIGLAPSAAENTRMELDCYLALNTLLLWTLGGKSPEVAAALSKASELADQIDDDALQFKVNWQKWSAEHFGAQDSETAARTAEKLLEIGLRQDDDGAVLQAHHSAWTTSWTGENLQKTLHHSEQGMRLYDPDRHGHHANEWGGHDPGVCCRTIGSLAHTFLGRLDTGLQYTKDALVICDQVDHKFSEVFTRAFASTVYLMRRDPAALVDWVAEMENRVEADGATFTMIATTPKILKGWGMIMLGQTEEGSALLEQSLAQVVETGYPRMAFQYYVACEGLLHMGRTADAEAYLDKAFENSAETKEIIWLPEMYRMQAKLDVERGDQEGAVENFQQALTLSGGQGTKLFELRAATGLAQLWAERGNPDEAKALLAPIHAEIKEGLDTADLQDSKRLLDAL